MKKKAKGVDGVRTVLYNEQLHLSGERVVALGFFDGVHLGHRDMLERAREAANARGIELAVFTFLSESTALKSGTGRIYDTKTRLSLLEQIGIDLVILADFDSVRHLTHEQFTNRILLSQLGTALAVAGFNFRYGRGAEGNAASLKAQLQAAGRDALIVPAYLAEDGEPLSASKIKGALLSGEMERANAYLKIPYCITSEIEEGLHLGRTYGIPTLNQPFPEGTLIPRLGVYRCDVKVGERIYHAVTNVGECPTFGARPPHAETFVLTDDFSADNNPVTVYLLGYLREERTFNGAESLKMQINIDKNTALERNGDLQWLINGQS